MESKDSSSESIRAPAILLIAQEAGDLQSLQHQLSEEGFNCVTHTEVLEGIEYATQIIPDAVVIDGAITAISAAEAGKILKSKLPFISLILWGVDLDSATVSQCLEQSGFDLYLDKSHPPPLFLSHLRVMLRNTQQLRQLMESNRRLNRLSVSDPLTGLFNHKHLLDWLQIEFKRSERNLEPLSCIMIDIDHFKSVNDTYGHKFGDFVLREFSIIVQNNIRKIDILGRYGGEEFLVILPNTDLFGAINLAEKLRKIIECQSFKEGVFEAVLSASFGVASTSDERILRADHLLQMADKALYISKESGRNRVCSPDEVHQTQDNLMMDRREADFDVQGRVVHLLYRDESVRARLHDSISAAGFRVRSSAQKEELFEKLRRFPCDILVMDDVLDEEAKAEVVQQLRGYDRHLGAAVITVTQNEQDLQVLELSGLDETGVTARIPEDFLIPCIQSLIKIKSLQADLRESNTRLKIAQRKLIRSERLKALGEMSSGVAHDLNNILGIILGRAQYLKGKVSEEYVLRSLEIIEKSALDGAQTLRRILEFFRPEVPMHIEQLYVHNLIDNCLEFSKVRWRDEANLRGLHYDIETDVDEKLITLGSESELSEVFINLIFNALDAMPEGGRLTLAAEQEGDDEIAITIKDTGTGMPEEVVEKIFNPFFTTKKDKGTGLGMSVVSNIVSRHNGRIDVDSKPGIGTTFIIHLPLFKGEQSLPPHAVEAAEIAAEETQKAWEMEQVDAVVAQEIAHRPLRIMLVDDEEDILQVFYDILSESGYEVAKCSHGKDALDLFSQRAYDVVITDLGMPDISGWDVARGVKEIQPRTVVILTSGWREDYSKKMLRERGVNYALPKPVGVNNLLKMIKNVENELTGGKKKVAP